MGRMQDTQVVPYLINAALDALCCALKQLRCFINVPEGRFKIC